MGTCRISECDPRAQARAVEQGKVDRGKAAPRPKHVWSIRTKLQIEGRARDLAMFNLANSKLRGCDVVAIRVEDVAAGGYTADRATVRQKKTGRPVRFELSEQTREAIDDYLKAANKRPGELLFTGRRGPDRSMTTRQYARLVSEWIGSVGLDPRLFGTHSLRRTKATLIYRRTQSLHFVRCTTRRMNFDVKSEAYCTFWRRECPVNRIDITHIYSDESHGFNHDTAESARLRTTLSPTRSVSRS